MDFLNIMIRIADEKYLLASFRELDRDEVILTQEIKFPIGISDYFAWTEPSGNKAFLVLVDPVSNKPLGAVMHKYKGGEVTVGMCEWCHTVRGSDVVGMMTAAVSEKKRVGTYVCTDLKCKENIASTPGVNDLRTSAGKMERILLLQRRMVQFFQTQLF
jgi:hypothetical protein